jgi:aminoglycoside phosphotransferase family enzyme/predicted kinase
VTPTTQTEVFAFLQDSATHPDAPSVTRVDTHGAAVFLAGPDVYKVKRAVRYPYMDFSTLERRRAACEKEVAVNAVNAPGLYRGTVPIRRTTSGLRLGGDTGEIIEWAVHLARFDETTTLDRLAAAGRIDGSLLGKLARRIAEAHRRAPVVTDVRAVDDFRDSVRDTVTELRAGADLLGAFDPQPALRRLGDEIEALRPLLDERCALGFVRRCHGDLHLRNVALIDGEPTLFDAIEFDDRIATCDVLFDLAFMLMDLCSVGLQAEANTLLNRTLWLEPGASDHLSGLAAIPAFLAERAAIRAKVALSLARLDVRIATTQVAEARRYLELASDFLEPRPARLVAIGGLSGSGKTSLALALAPRLGGPPGAVVLRSDIERKRMFGVDELTPLPPSAYTAESTVEVYARLRRAAEAALGAGASVIVDAVHLRPEERAAIAEVAHAMGAGFDGLWLEARGEVLSRRVAARTGDASDATADVVAMQARIDVGPLDWTVIPAGGLPQDVARAAGAALSLTSEP